MFDANLYRRGLATGPTFENANEIVSKVDGAIEILKQLEADLKTLSKAAAYLKSKDNNECTCTIPGIDANNPAYCPTCGKHHRTIEWK